MPLLTKTDLQFTYSWATVSPDAPRHTEKQYSTGLNRGDGHEILAFINAVAQENGWKQKASGLKLERLIHLHLPFNVSNHAKVE